MIAENHSLVITTVRVFNSKKLKNLSHMFVVITHTS